MENKTFREIPYTSWWLARNQDGRLYLFDTMPWLDKLQGNWYVYHNGERFEGMLVNYTNSVCRDITFENSPVTAHLTYEIQK